MLLLELAADRVLVAEDEVDLEARVFSTRFILITEVQSVPSCQGKSSQDRT